MGFKNQLITEGGTILWGFTIDCKFPSPDWWTLADWSEGLHKTSANISPVNPTKGPKAYWSGVNTNIHKRCFSHHISFSVFLDISIGVYPTTGNLQSSKQWSANLKYMCQNVVKNILWSKPICLSISVKGKHVHRQRVGQDADFLPAQAGGLVPSESTQGPAIFSEISFPLDCIFGGVPHF